jgi:hypothetical protein
MVGVMDKANKTDNDIADARLRDVVMARVKAAGGVVELDGEQLIRRSVLREVLSTVTDEIVAGMRSGLMADHPDDTELELAIDEVARRIQATVATLVPTRN